MRRREPSLSFKRTIATRLGASWVAKTTSSPLSMNTGVSLRVPSVVSRTGSSPAWRCRRREATRIASVHAEERGAVDSLRAIHARHVLRAARGARHESAELMPASSRIVAPTIAGVIGSLTGCSPRASLSPIVRPGWTPPPAQSEK